jgi:hypothetical protein
MPEWKFWLAFAVMVLAVAAIAIINPFHRAFSETPPRF